MEKDIKKQRFRMYTVIGLLLAFTGWQFSFVSEAIMSNIFLNGAIIGNFFFGASVIFSNVYKLNNETRAISALKEEFEDNQADLYSKNPDDKFWRYRRCQKLGVVFDKPEILGENYQIISEELARTGTLRISADTAQTLVNSVDDRLADQKSLPTFLTGIQIMLGLIGTFVGLMITLASVSAILGSIDFSSGDAMATVQRLIKNLEVPLGGMATGFSSSLFGLITSLILGILSQFAGIASNSLRSGFESWLATLSYIDIENSTRGAAANDDEIYNNTARMALAEQRKHLELIMNSARFVVATTGRNTKAITQLYDALENLTKESQTTQKVVHLMSENLNKNHILHENLSDAVMQLIDNLDKGAENSSQLQSILEQIRQNANNHTNDIGTLRKEFLSQENTIQKGLMILSEQLMDNNIKTDNSPDSPRRAKEGTIGAMQLKLKSEFKPESEQQAQKRKEGGRFTNFFKRNKNRQQAG